MIQAFTLGCSLGFVLGVLLVLLLLEVLTSAEKTAMEPRPATLDALKGQVKQLTNVQDAMRVQIGSLLEISKTLTSEQHKLKAAVSALESRMTGVLASLSPDRRRAPEWEPSVPPPGYLRRELDAMMSTLNRLKRHVALPVEAPPGWVEADAPPSKRARR